MRKQSTALPTSVGRADCFVNVIDDQAECLGTLTICGRNESQPAECSHPAGTAVVERREALRAATAMMGEESELAAKARRALNFAERQDRIAPRQKAAQKASEEAWSHRDGRKPEGIVASRKAPQRGTRSDDPSAKPSRGLVKAAYISVFNDGRSLELDLPGLPPLARLKRGDIEGFSDASRRRLLTIMHRIRRDAPLPIMVTLTFPEELTVTGKEAKACYLALAKRVERIANRWAALWRLEAHPEMSRRLGRMHPHLHLLCWNVWFDLDWLSKAWSSVVWEVLKVDAGMSDTRAKHESAGTNAQRVRKWEGVAYMVKSYMAKGEEYPLGKSGRVWGWWKGKRLPLAKAEKVELNHLQVIAVKRRVAEWMAVKGIKSEYLLRTIFSDNPRAFATMLLAPTTWQKEKEYHDASRSLGKA